jgi:hypothetical protein
MAPVPPRNEALPEDRMLVSFDLDCGELVRGHRFVARGVAEDGVIPAFGDQQAADGISLEYELVPGVEPSDDGGSFFHYLVGIEYSADVELPWEPNDGGAIAPFRGGASTHGSRGSWPLPQGANQLTFTLFAVGDSGFPNAEPAGSINVDLSTRTGVWRPSS